MYKDPALPNVLNFVSNALQLRAFEQQLIMPVLEWNSICKYDFAEEKNDIPPTYRRTLTLPNPVA
jgi:hypothetical protein